MPVSWGFLEPSLGLLAVLSHAAQRRLLVLAPRRLHRARLDNIARILGVKYHLLLPEHERVGSALDYFQRAAILRSVSALTEDALKELTAAV